MNTASLTIPRLSGWHTLTQLIAVHFATCIALAAAIWLELSEWLASGLLVAALALALLTAICAGRTLAYWQASLPARERSSISGRGTGVLVLVALGSMAIACAMLVYPRSWPTSVEEAVATLSDQLDGQERRDLAYMGYDDLTAAQDRLGAPIEEQFGLHDGNDRLLRDCDPEYVNAHSCSSIVISRLWKKVRGELPPAERLPLEALEAKMERVRLKSEQFQNVPLKELVGFLNDAIRAQLPQEAWFNVIHDPALSEQPVSTSWHVVGMTSLREALGVFAAGGQWRVRKDPPDLVLERASPPDR